MIAISLRTICVVGAVAVSILVATFASSPVSAQAVPIDQWTAKEHAEFNHLLKICHAQVLKKDKKHNPKDGYHLPDADTNKPDEVSKDDYLKAQTITCAIEHGETIPSLKRLYEPPPEEAPPTQPEDAPQVPSDQKVS